MICISVTPTSRQLAKVDLLNAAGQGDLIELCLDHLIKPPDMKELLDGVNKPMLVSCRRQQEGGHWKGTDDQRMKLLREAIVAGPAYVELDLETARNVPRFGDTKRVISYTRLDRPLRNIDSVFQDAAKVNADVVKFTWPTPTLESAWPLLAGVTKKRDLPVVGLGLGRAGLMFSLLGRKYGSPWIYAALERGMEAFEDQATVGELDEVYGWRDISPQTRFIGIVGVGPAETTTVRVFNTVFKKRGINARCLPLVSNQFDKLQQMLDVLKINAIITSRDLGERILPLAEHTDEAVRLGQHADLLLKQPDGWHAYNSIWRTASGVLESMLGKRTVNERPLDSRNVLIIGTGGLAQSLVYGVLRRKGLVSVTGSNEKATQQIAQRLQARFVPFHNLYDTLADIVVLADPDLRMGVKKSELNPSFLRAPMTFIDVGCMPQDGDILKEARGRGCTIVEPLDIYLAQVASQFKSVTGHDVSSDEFRVAVNVEG